MTTRVAVSPALLTWAVDRSGRDVADVEHKHPQLEGWLTQQNSPTLRQLQDFARTTYTPIGYFFLTEPPEEALPIADFRTVKDAAVTHPSANLIEVLQDCERRQEWYSQYASRQGIAPCTLFRIATLEAAPAAAAASMRAVVGFGVDERRGLTRDAAVRALADALEDVGVLVMISGIVGSNTARQLDAQEFRGFTLADDRAPVIFVNGVDSRGAQLFTLAHEAAHVMLGISGISNASPVDDVDNRVERWCNAVAAEFLVPLEALRDEFETQTPLPDEVGRLSRAYHVSTLVILRRIRDLDHLDWASYRSAYQEEEARISRLTRTSARASGGDFYRTLPIRTSRRFTRDLVADTLEGSTLYTEASRLLGVRSPEVVDQLGERMGVA